MAWSNRREWPVGGRLAGWGYNLDEKRGNQLSQSPGLLPNDSLLWNKSVVAVRSLHSRYVCTLTLLTPHPRYALSNSLLVWNRLVPWFLTFFFFCPASSFASIPHFLYILTVVKIMPSGPFIYYQFYTSKIMHYAHRVCLCVVYATQDKQRPLLYTVLTYWFLITDMKSVYCAVRTWSLSKTD